MACNNCKKDEGFIYDSEKDKSSLVGSNNSKIMWVILIWTLFGLYGFVSLIIDLL